MSVDLTSQNRFAYPLLATRFFLPPLPVACVPRPRLMELLKLGLHVPLTLISAPPGFGKSALIRQWVHDQENVNAGWLSVEPSDADFGQFFRYLVAAWQRIFPQVGEAALAEWKENVSIRKEILLDLLLNDILAGQEKSETHHSLLVLDDYHRIESPEIHETIAYLVEHLPPGCHLALLTRADPTLPVARWRSRGQVLEVRADDLRFTFQEAAEYFNQRMNLGLSGAQIAVLQDRTEGWIVGLQMAALALQGTVATPGTVATQGALLTNARNGTRAFVDDFSGSNRFVVDYLVEEVLRQQPVEIQQFLLKTALLNQFCGPLCDALLGTRDSQQMLERLEKANLFLIPLDDRRCWYRYHHLFADLLRVRLRQTDPEQVPVLYRVAAEWYVQSGLWRDAVNYALQTQDMDFSADLFEAAILKGGLNFLYTGMRPLVESFPLPVVQKRPLLSLAKAMAIFDSSQLEGIEPLLRSVEARIRSLPPFPDQADVLGWIYIIQVDAALQLGNHAWAIEASQQIPRWIPKDFESHVEALVKLGLSAYYEGDLNQTEMYWQQGLDLSLASNSAYHIIALLNCMARLTNLKGELKRSESLFRQAFDLLEEHHGKYLIWLGAMQRDYSDLLRDLNRLEEARDMIVTAIPLLEKWHSISALGYGFFSGARILMASGDLPAAHAMLNKVEDLHRRYTLYPDLETLVQVTRARLYLEAGDTGQAWRILETCLNSACGQHTFILEWVLIVQARILFRTCRPAEALTLLAGWLERAKANGRGRNWLTICLLTALALYASSDREKAFHLLGEGLLFAQEQGHRRALIEEGEAMHDLLEAFRVQFPQSPFADYITEILALFPVPFSGKPGASVKVDGLEESLSPRELEILRLVCQGLSNQEIARRLVLSVGTVKFHIHHIFGKLGVRDRPQAIAKAAQLGM